MLVNIVSHIPASVWERELPPGLAWDFFHTSEAGPADIHVIYGIRTPLRIPNSPQNVIFIASEPPEIRVYDSAVLSRYGAVLGPGFEYLLPMPHFHAIAAVAPWWVGLKAGGEEHYEAVDGSATLSRAVLAEGFSPGRDVVTAIVSQKARTPLQQQRLRLVDFLSTRLNDFEAYGLAAERVGDKADVLGSSRYHLAVENSAHPGYWTEKLSDPILMDNVVFYGGHASYADYFSDESILPVDPWDPESTYESIAKALERDTWAQAADARAINRCRLLEQYSFHRVLAAYLSQHPHEAAKSGMFAVPAQHPTSRVKKFFDPIYRRIFG